MSVSFRLVIPRFSVWAPIRWRCCHPPRAAVSVAALAAPLVAALFGLVIGAITLGYGGRLCDRHAVLRRSAAVDRQQLDRADERADGNLRYLKAVVGHRRRRAAAEDGVLLCGASARVSFTVRLLPLRLFQHRPCRDRRPGKSSGGAVGWHFAVHLGLVTFVLAAGIAGLAGGFYANYVSFVGPEVFGFSFMITMIIMVLAGGKGTLVGPVVGAIIVVVLEEYLRDFKELRFSIFGLIVMAVVLFLPRGIMGFIVRRHERYVRGESTNA